MISFFHAPKTTLAHLRRLARRWKLITVRKLLYLPHILNVHEKRILLLLLIILVAGAGGLASRMYIRLTHPVPAVGGSYSEGIIGEPHTINPIYASRDSDRDIARLIFSGLVTYQGNGEIEKDLADGYEISRDGKSYTVFLKKGVTWHDGKTLDADDVIFTVHTIQNPQYKSPLRANWQGVEVEKIDQYTVRFSLRSPYAPFIENLTQGIIPKHLWEGISPDQAVLHELNIHPVGSGPYRFSRLKQNSDGTLNWYAMARNKIYYREGPYIDTISFFFFETEEQMIQAWHRGDIDGFGPISLRRIAQLPRDKVSILNLQMPRIFSIFFNDKKAPVFKDAKIRSAIARALDTRTIAAEATFGGAIAIDQILPQFRTGTSGDDITRYPYDPDAARRILEEAGWKEINQDGIREKKVRQKGKTETQLLRVVLSTSDWPDLLRSAQRIKGMLKEVGIDVTVEQKSFSDLESSVIRTRNFELLLFGQVYGYEPDPFAFWHSSQIKDPGLNIGLYASKKADKILEEARRSANQEERIKKYEEFIRIASKDIPAIPLYTQLYLYLLPADIQGVALSKIALPADRLNDVNIWYRKTKRIFF